jgi:hypothetical protein
MHANGGGTHARRVGVDRMILYTSAQVDEWWVGSGGWVVSYWGWWFAVSKKLLRWIAGDPGTSHLPARDRMCVCVCVCVGGGGGGGFLAV